VSESLSESLSASPLPAEVLSSPDVVHPPKMSKDRRNALRILMFLFMAVTFLFQPQGSLHFL
jgi:hypothetical protein